MKFKQLRNKMTDKSFDMITSGIFTTTLIYCISVFGHVWPTVDLDDTERRFSAFTKEDCRRLQTLQNETMRLRLRAPRYHRADI